MSLSAYVFQRYDVLYDFYINDLWTRVPADLMRNRPHARVNSIAWNLWHLTRVEDAGLNRFVVDGTQVLDDGGWMTAMNLPWRHNGFGMTFAEVDELDERIDLTGLEGYSRAVQARTRSRFAELDDEKLAMSLPADRLRRIMADEGLGRSRVEAEGLAENYLGWTAGKCLMVFGITHPYQHVGEIGVIAGLLGIDF